MRTQDITTLVYISLPMDEGSDGALLKLGHLAGIVRIMAVEDLITPLETVLEATFKPQLRPGQSESDLTAEQLASQRAAFLKRIGHDGIYTISLQHRTHPSERWVQASGHHTSSIDDMLDNPATEELCYRAADWMAKTFKSQSQINDLREVFQESLSAVEKLGHIFVHR